MMLLTILQGVECTHSTTHQNETTMSSHAESSIQNLVWSSNRFEFDGFCRLFASLVFISQGTRKKKIIITVMTISLTLGVWSKTLQCRPNYWPVCGVSNRRKKSRNAPHK